MAPPHLVGSLYVALLDFWIPVGLVLTISCSLARFPFVFLPLCFSLTS